MRTKSLIGALIAGGVLGLNALSATAAGLGRINVLSSLGQPLQAEIELVAVQKGELESLSARIPSPDTFRDAKIEYSRSLSNVSFSVEKRPNGQPYLRLTSAQPINEPFLDVLVELTWSSGRLLREFPILLDPPGVETKSAATPVQEPAKTAATPVAPAPAKPAAEATPATKPSGAAAVAGEKAAPGNYTVQQGDTLSAIASRNRPAGVNLDQMLVALFRQNQQAFIGNNMNRMRAGQILRIPTADEAKATAAAEAKEEVRVQSADFAAYRQKLAGQVAEAPTRRETATQTAAGKIGGAVVEQEVPKAEAPKDVLKLSKGGVVAGKAGAKGALISQERANALQEEAIAKDNQLKEERARASELEKNIQEMQRLLELKNQNLAELQKQAAAKSAPPAVERPATKAPAESTSAPVLAPAEPAKAPAVTEAAQAPQAEEVKPSPEVRLTPEAKPTAEAKPEEAAKPVPPAPPVKKPARAPAPLPEPSFLDELTGNPLYLALGALIVVLAGIFGFSAVRRRQSAAAASTGLGATSTLATDLKSGTFSGVKSGGIVDTGNSSFLTDFEKTGPGVIDTEEVDPVAEAEVYIAYGRDAQAEEILKEAMAKDTSRHEIPMKLLEIYAARKSATSFETVASELLRSVGSDHPVWSRVAEMGRQLDPINPLYAAPATGADSFAAAAGANVIAATAAAAAAPVSRSEPELTMPPVLASASDADLDLNLSAPTAGAHGLDLPVDEAMAHPEALPALDFSLNAVGPAQSTARPAASLDFDLSGLDVAAKPATPTEVSAAAKGGRATQFADDELDLTEFNLDKPVASTPTPIAPKLAAAPTAAPSSAPAPLDLSSLSLDLGTSAPGTLAEAVPEQEGESAWHSVATKLDLARAYLEIGDKEGAREILQEVMNEGDADQRREAQTLSAALA